MHPARPAIAHRRLLAAGVAAVLLGACATPQVTPQPAEPVPDLATQPPASRERLKPMPLRPLNLRTDCQFSDDAGYSASAQLDIEQSDVRAFFATVSVPRRGACRFELADFRQVRKQPHVELRAADGCSIHVWEQGEQITVAFAGCASRCDRGTFDYVWPILVDRPSGRCH